MNRFFLLLLLVALPLSAAPSKRYIVTRSEGEVNASAKRVVDAEFMAAHAGRELGIINGFAVTLTDAEVAALQKEPGVGAIYPVVERHLLDVSTSTGASQAPISPFMQKQSTPYGIDLVRARDVWPHARGKNVNVAVLDTGITADHPDLKANIAGGYNAITHGTNYADDHGHGTHVAGTIAAADNTLGVIGVAPEARIWAIKLLDADGNGTNEDVIVAADWILAKKAEIGGNWIMSMSFGSGETSPPEEAAFRRLRDANVLPIAASGNSGFLALEYPAAYASVMSVGAVDSAKTLAWFSSGGGTLGVLAPGVNVLSTVRLGTNVTVLAERGGSTILGAQFMESGRGGWTAQIVKCGYGGPGECEGDATGKVALMQRGNNLTFAEKVLNATAQGAIAAIIVNYDDKSLYETGRVSLVRRTCDIITFECVDDPADRARQWPVAIFVTKSDGDKLANGSGTVFMGVWDDDYGFKSGTSMATPHATGVAALLWSLAPNATAIDLRRAMELTAEDLGPKGFDASYGNGLVNALAAAKALSPATFGLPPGQMPTPRRRSINH
jgi:serine protease